MSSPAPVSAAFHAAFARELLPLLQRLGFAAAKPKSVKPGLVVAVATRQLGAGRRLDATLWCDAARGSNLRFRLDVVEAIKGVEVSRQVELEVPWPDPSSPKPSSLDFSGKELLPEESPERLALAITFLAGAFAASLHGAAQKLPELGDELRAAAATVEWNESVTRAKRVWENRHIRGEIDERVAPATVVFVGASLVTVEADAVRLTFRMDTKELDPGRPVSVARWFKTSAGSLRALRLINDTRSWEFDVRGQLVVTAPAR
jgi:hypothetical protein